MPVTDSYNIVFGLRLQLTFSLLKRAQCHVKGACQRTLVPWCGNLEILFADILVVCLIVNTVAQTDMTAKFLIHPYTVLTIAQPLPLFVKKSAGHWTTMTSFSDK
eukprot:4912986-Amphidinium_carterae.3